VEVAVDEMEKRNDNPTMAEKKNLVFRGIDHCHCERVGHSMGVHMVDLELLVKERRIQLKVH